MRLLLDCAQICATSEDFMLRRSDMDGHVCGVCAHACARCADDCERVDAGRPFWYLMPAWQYLWSRLN